MNGYPPPSNCEPTQTEKQNWQRPYSFVGLQVFMICIGISLLCTVVLMVIALFQGLGLPSLGEIGSIVMGVFTIYSLKERTSWGYWLGMLYAAGFFAAGCGFAAASGLLYKILGIVGLIAGIYFMVYLFARRDSFQ